MPELPEVETTRAGIEPEILNKKIISVTIRNHQLRWPIDNQLPERIQGQSVVSVARRAKYLLIRLTSGTLIIHLGMSGSIRLTKDYKSFKKHDHVDVLFEHGVCLRFNDPRRFGAILYTTVPVLEHSLLNHLGPEPLSEDFNTHYFLPICQKKSQPIKSVLMNARLVVGVGNIYANEALFLSRINPLTPANHIEEGELRNLINIVKKVLHQAILQGGTTLKDFSNPDGKPGYFAQELLVYGRKGKPCTNCETELVEVRLQNRSSIYCPNCQKF